MKNNAPKMSRGKNLIIVAIILNQLIKMAWERGRERESGEREKAETKTLSWIKGHIIFFW